MRNSYMGVVQDEFGDVSIGAGISVYLAGTNTAVKVYSAKTGGTWTQTAPQRTTDSKGGFSFWVDDIDYDINQLFKIKIEPVVGNSIEYDNVEIFKPIEADSVAVSLTPNFYTASTDRVESHLGGINNFLGFVRRHWTLTGIVPIHGVTITYSYTSDRLTSITFGGSIGATASFTYTGDKLTQEIWSQHGITITINHSYTGDLLTYTTVTTT